MIAFVTLFTLAASCSAGSLDHLARTTLDRNYLPPSQTPNNLYLPPAPTPTTNRVYLPPSPPPTPNRVYLTPSPPPTPNRVYLTPSPPPTPNNLYLSPSPTPTPNNNYIPPSPPASHSPVYLPPQQTPTPNNVYSAPSSRPDNLYLPPSQPNNVYLSPSSTGGPYGSSGITGAVFRQQISTGRPVAIVKQINENNGDGVYTFSFETEDGTTAEERGQLKADGAEGTLSAQGSFSFTAPDNNRYTVTYTADENGFQPQGAHLPVPPPIPEAILKSLADNAADEARGIVDDGSYREESQGYQRVSAGSSQSHAGYGQRSSLGQGGYQQERPAQGGYQQERPAQSGYQRDVPSRPFNF